MKMQDIIHRQVNSDLSKANSMSYISNCFTSNVHETLESILPVDTDESGIVCIHMWTQSHNRKVDDVSLEDMPHNFFSFPQNIRDRVQEEYLLF